MTLLRVTRTGGFAGLTTTAEVDLPDALDLLAAARGLAPAEQPGLAGPGRGADRFVYELSVAGERTVVPEDALTAALRARLDEALAAHGHPGP